MNKEELIKLKNELTEQMYPKKTSTKKYVIGNILDFLSEKRSILNEEEQTYEVSYSNKELYNKSFTKEEIIELEKTEEAIKYLESSIEEYLKNLIKKGYNVAEFKCYIKPTCILSEDYRDKVYMNCFNDSYEKAIIPLIGKDVLDDYIVIDICYFAGSLEKDMNVFERMDKRYIVYFYDDDPLIETEYLKEEDEEAKKYNKYFLVQCSKFFEALKYLNYEINNDVTDDYSEISSSDFFKKIVDASLYDVDELAATEIIIDLTSNKKKSR